MSEVKKVITVAERSTKALVKVVADGQKLFSDLASLAGSTVTLTEEIEFKQGQLADIENQIAASERESKAQLRLRVIENEDKVLAELMKARGYAVITHADLDALNSDLVAAKTDNEYEYPKRVKLVIKLLLLNLALRTAIWNPSIKLSWRSTKPRLLLKTNASPIWKHRLQSCAVKLPQSVKPVSKSLAPTLVARVLWLTPVRTNHGVASSEATV
ncbi:hypothetical protein M4C14_23025 [Klebsiella pneumoniae]|nr:hypothetical protein [Klebsiella pneumoniae]